MKTKIGVSLLIIFLIFSTACSWYYLFMERKKSTRLETDIRNGYQTGFRITEYYKAKNGDLVARNSVLELTKKELANGLAQDVLDKLNNLGINPKTVNNYSSTVMEHDTHIITRVHDSILYDTVHAECFNYSDKYNKINGCKVGEYQSINIYSVDSLLQVVYSTRYNPKSGKTKPRWFFWLPKKLDQVISSDNPSTKVVYSKTISIVK